jgi:phage gpG-like protein
LTVRVKFNSRRLKKRLEKAQRKALKDVLKVLDREIPSTILSGKSPVEGEGRFEKYSLSYRQQIKGEAYLDPDSGEYFIFRKINGRTVPIEVENKKIDQPKEFRDKKVSPVNLKLTGKLLSSFFTKLKNATTLVIGFDNELADIHNRQGAGKSKVVRRMLPFKGERFNANIRRKVRDAAKKAFPKAFR